MRKKTNSSSKNDKVKIGGRNSKESKISLTNKEVKTKTGEIFLPL